MDLNATPCGIYYEDVRVACFSNAFLCPAPFADGSGNICNCPLESHPHAPPTGALDSLSPIRQSLPPPPSPPDSIPPPSLNGQKLYEREAASRALFDLLHNTLGTRITPFCDNCFGAGKTSLIWKFRNVLNGIQGWEWPAESQPLRDAIYIHVQFVDSLTPNHPLNFENPDEIDRMLLQRFTRVFSLSLRNFHLAPASFDELISIVNERCGEYKLLVHMDDIGAYEHCEHAQNILYRMWHIGEKFRLNGGHYYVLTGRSSHLHTIGKSLSKANPGCFESTNPGELIPLPLLTKISIKLILQEHAARLPLDLFNENDEPKEEIINHIYSFTGGVPRAVNAAILCYMQKNKPTVTQVEDFILIKCHGPTLNHQDRAIFHCCLELSWAQISMTNEETILNEPITAVIARLGIYRNNHLQKQLKICNHLHLQSLSI